MTYELSILVFLGAAVTWCLSPLIQLYYGQKKYGYVLMLLLLPFAIVGVLAWFSLANA